MNGELRLLMRELLKRRYDAEFNARYHDLLARRYHRLDSLVKVILATTAVLAFIGMKIGGNEPWQTISGATALIATTVLPLFKWHKLIPRIEAERLRWIALKQEYRDAWNDAKTSGDWTAAKKDLRRLRKRDNATEKSGGIIPEHRGLLATAQREVIAAFRSGPH
jgi:hypothetical protein